MDGGGFGKIGNNQMISEDLEKYDYRKNIIVDEDNSILIWKAWRDHFSAESHWKARYGGQAYLSRPNSEDALTWNVFRSLQKLGDVGLDVISGIFNISQVENILFWGCDVENHGEEQQLLNILIRITDGKFGGTMTEPDVVIIAEKEAVFVECKLNQNGKDSPWKAQGEGWIKRFEIYLNEFSELENISDPNRKDMYQLIRQYVYAKLLGNHLNKTPLVIPIINEKHQDILSQYYSKMENFYPVVFQKLITWQQIGKTISESNIINNKKILSKIDETLNYVNK